MYWAWMSERYLVLPRARQVCVCVRELQSQDDGRGLSGWLSPEGRLWGQGDMPGPGSVTKQFRCPGCVQEGLGSRMG